MPVRVLCCDGGAPENWENVLRCVVHVRHVFTENEELPRGGQGAEPHSTSEGEISDHAVTTAGAATVRHGL